MTAYYKFPKECYKKVIQLYKNHTVTELDQETWLCRTQIIEEEEQNIVPTI